MATAPRPDDRLAALEREHAERLARAHADLAAAQERAYWLDRWGIDLNALMRRRGAAELRAAVRAVRAVRRRAIRAKRSLEARLARPRAPAGPGGPPSPATALTRGLPLDPLRAAPVTDALYERLGEAGVAAAQRAATPGRAREIGGADGARRRRLVLSAGVDAGVAEVLSSTGLAAASAPEAVRAAVRGPVSTAAALYHADVVLEALAAGGLQPRAGLSVLELGCAPGHVAQALAAAHPECEWHGIDASAEAIEWAAANLPGVSFAAGSDSPPLPYDDAAFDALYALALWTRLAPPAALAWLEEARRVVRPGGTLVLAARGRHSIARAGARDGRDPVAVERALDADGIWFAPDPGAGGANGGDRDRGTAFVGAEWLLATATPDWRVAAFAPGRVDGDRDLYVLVRA